MVYVGFTTMGPPQFYLRRKETTLRHWGLDTFDAAVAAAARAGTPPEPLEARLVRTAGVTVGVYRVNARDIARWSHVCPVAFSTLGPLDRLIRGALKAFDFEDTRRMDAVLNCPDRVLAEGRAREPL